MKGRKKKKVCHCRTKGSCQRGRGPNERGKMMIKLFRKGKKVFNQLKKAKTVGDLEHTFKDLSKRALGAARQHVQKKGKFYRKMQGQGLYTRHTYITPKRMLHRGY